MIIENLQRRDLHPLEYAEGFDRLITQRGYTVETLATKLKKGTTYFLLRAKDPAAPFLVLAWQASRQGNWNELANYIMGMAVDADIKKLVSSDDYDKLSEARSCAAEMIKWREDQVVQTKEAGDGQGL